MIGEPSRILIVKMSAIGDVVHSIPFLEAMAERYPRARIDWLVEEGSSGIIEGHPALDHVIVLPRSEWRKRWTRSRDIPALLWEMIRFVTALRSTHYDLVVDLQGLLKSGLMVGVSRGRRKVGMKGSREGARLFLKEPPVYVNYEQHAIDRYLDLAGALGCATISRGGRIPVSSADRVAVDRLLETHGLGERPIIAFNPMARWGTKLWYAERFAGLADRVKERFSCDVVLTGGPADVIYLDGIVSKAETGLVNLSGRTTLKELACLYDMTEALVTTDTGPMHIAAAMGCPVIALFGPTSPRRTGPYGAAHKVVTAEVDCAPCFRKKCNDMRCMDGIAVDRVLSSVEDILGRSSRSLYSPGLEGRRAAQEKRGI